MRVDDPWVSLLVAVGAGLVIGLEREQSHHAEEDDKRGAYPLAGARTHPLAALAGAVSMLLAKGLGGWVVAVGLLAIVLLVALGFQNDLRRGREGGITSEVTFILTFLLGALATSERIIEPVELKLIIVAAIAVIITALLSFKEPIHGFAAKLTREEIYSSVKFLVVLVIVLPQLPDAKYGPFDALNPFQIGMMIVLIAAISLVGYVLVRLLGSGRGLGLMGLIGGLASSTAVTLAMAGRAKNDPAVRTACGLAIVLASTVSYARVGVEVWVVFRPLLRDLVFPLAGMVSGGLVAAGVLYLRSRRDAAKSEKNLDLKNPFELASALKFGLLFAGASLLAHAASDLFGSGGTYVAGAVAGMADVDAITLSMARMASEGLTGTIAATAIFLALISNTIVKTVLAIVVGGGKLGRSIALAHAAALAGGGAGLTLAWQLV